MGVHPHPGFLYIFDCYTSLAGMGIIKRSVLCHYTTRLIFKLQVLLSTRRGSWIFNRITKNGYPGDLTGLRRINDLIRKYLPTKILLKTVEKRLNERFDHINYGLKPKHSPFSQHPTVNDELPNRLEY